jgi:hypothetical protein
VQRLRLDQPDLVTEVTLHQGHDARVAGGLLVLGKHLEHDEVGPPVLVFGGAEGAVRALVLHRPLHPLLHLGDEPRVVERIGERHEAVQVVRTALPAFAGAAQPAAFRTEVRPELVQVAAQSAGLDLQLPLEPAAGLDRTERQGPVGERFDRLDGEGGRQGEDGYAERHANSITRLAGPGAQTPFDPETRVQNAGIFHSGPKRCFPHSGAQ